MNLQVALIKLSLFYLFYTDKDYDGASETSRW